MKIKKFEAYEINPEEHEDFAEEHAKALITKFIEEELKGFTIEDSMEWLATQYDLDEDLKSTVFYAAKQYLQSLGDKFNHYQDIVSEND